MRRWILLSIHGGFTVKDQNRTRTKGTSRSTGCLAWLGASPASLLGLLLVGYIYEFLAEAADAEAYPPPGHLVDVGGYRLHINCTGNGSPAVVIDAGLGDWSTGWGFVQQEVAKRTRVCTYDRAGWGWSDPTPLRFRDRCGRSGILPRPITRPIWLYSGLLAAPFEGRVRVPPAAGAAGR